MISSLAKSIVNRFFNENDKYPLEVYVYGVELLISSLISTVVIFVIGALTKTFFESVIFLISFSLIRVYTGGYHSMTYLKCNIVSALSYIAIVVFLYLITDFIKNPVIMLCGYVLTMFLAIIFAPVKHENKNLTTEEEKKYKTLSLLMITIVYMLCCAGYYIFDVKAMLIILPTCISIDIAMLVSVVINILKRRKL